MFSFVSVSCQFWLNQSNENPQRITKKYKKLVDSLDYKDINFPISKKIIKRLNKK